tara:strand:+ start:234 stop:896 length:663 start_codon:yes stop_codon:yes gene_type:complete
MKNFKNSSKTKIKDIQLYEQRIKKIDLIWVSQIINILKRHLNKKKISLNDCGCNLFQLYKGIKKKRLNTKISYRGYDHDKNYIKLGLKYFPELKKNFKIVDLEKRPPKKAEVSILSATMEHFINPDKGLKNILSATKRLIIIRSFFGERKIKKLFKNRNFVDNPYYINQFSFSWIKKKLSNQNFKKINIYKDKATKGKSRMIYPGIDRKFFIITAEKHEN